MSASRGGGESAGPVPPLARFGRLSGRNKMAAAATEEDTELRDLLVQTLESSGVLNKIKVRAEGLSSVCSALTAVRGLRCWCRRLLLQRGAWGCSAGCVPSSRHRPAAADTAWRWRPPSRRCPQSARVGAARGAVSSARLSRWS